MKELRDLTVRNETVVLDETEFHNCTFIGCQLKYSGGTVTFDNVHWSGCSFLFLEAAERTIQFLRHAKILPADPAQWRFLRRHFSN